MTQTRESVTSAEGAEPTTPQNVTEPHARHFHVGALAPYALPILLVVAIVGFSLLKPHTFPTVANLQVVLQSVAVNLVVVCAIMVPLGSNRFDLSVGSNLGLTGVVVGVLMANHHMQLIPAILIGFGVGAAIGVINGFFVAFLAVDSLIVTLGVATALTGITTWLSKGVLITNGLSANLTQIGADKVLGIPLSFLIAAGITLVVWYVTTQTVFGRYLGAIGSNEQSAGLVGVNVRRIVFVAFIMAGLLGAFAGILEIGNQGVADPSIGGIDILLPALAGTFLSVAAFTPGRYNVPGAVVGLLFVSVTITGLADLGAAPWVQPVFNGCAVVVAVTLSTTLHRRVRPT
jgi:ribose transport system permease protein